MPSARTLREKSENTQLPTPSPSTPVEDTLPAPVLHVTTHQKAIGLGWLGWLLDLHWTKFKRRFAAGIVASNDPILAESAVESSFTRLAVEFDTEHGRSGEVDGVVIDRMWSEEFKVATSHTGSENGSPAEKLESGFAAPTTSDRTSIDHERVHTFRTLIWPAIVQFFNSKFPDERSEQRYVQVRQFLPTTSFKRSKCAGHNRRTGS